MDFIFKKEAIFHLIKKLINFNVKKKFLSEQTLKYEFFRDIKDLVDTGFLIYKFQSLWPKEKWISRRKIILLRKNRGMREAKKISIFKAYILCKFLEKEKHILTIIVGYDLLGMQEILKKWNSYIIIFYLY